MKHLAIKRIYDTPSDSDGLRILVDRLWARGLAKEKAKLDFWEKDVAPSAELRKWYAHDETKFEEFKKRYIDELNANPLAADFKKKLLQQEGNVTLLFGAKDAAHSNAAVLAEWITQQAHS